MIRVTWFKQGWYGFLSKRVWNYFLHTFLCKRINRPYDNTVYTIMYLCTLYTANKPAVRLRISPYVATFQCVIFFLFTFPIVYYVTPLLWHTKKWPGGGATLLLQTSSSSVAAVKRHLFLPLCRVWIALQHSCMSERSFAVELYCAMRGSSSVTLYTLNNGSHDVGVGYWLMLVSSELFKFQDDGVP